MQLVIYAFVVSTLIIRANFSTEETDNLSIQDDEDRLSSKLRYLPEFNVNEEQERKWSFYLDRIRDANRQYVFDNSPSAGSNSSCAPFLGLANSDLKYFADVFGANFITNDLVNKMIQSKRAIHYQIVDHRLYRDRSCMFPSRCEGVEHFLLSLLPHLPNLDLFINVRDYPQVGKYFDKDQQYPIFSFSKDINSHLDIIYPAWTFWSGGPALDIYPHGIGRWDLSRESLLKAQSTLPWSKKKNVAFFRGSRTSAQRDPIVLLSRSRPDLVDAKYTKNQAWKSKADTLGEEPAKTASFEHHCHYKYLFNAHGVAASFRLKHLFLCRSLVLNVDSDWIEFFYPPLKPWIHYVPISRDFSDTAEILAFLADNQPIAAHIAKRGFEFIRNHLTMDSVTCYWRHLLEAYSSRLVGHRPNIPDHDLVQIKSSR